MTEFAESPIAATSAPAAEGPPATEAEPRRWPAAKRVAFRFAAVYFVLYAFPFPVSAVPWLGQLATNLVDGAWKQAAKWVGTQLLGIAEIPIVFTGSGDTTYDYVRLAMTLTLAVAGAAVWSALDRRRADYEKAARWLVEGVRFCLGFVLISYGVVKVVPVQFQSPSLARLLTPYGDFSPMGVVWSFMGASPAYTIFTGAGELVAGLLLFWRRTRLLGAAIATAVMAQVVALNLAYDVPVKLFSTHLLLMALALLWIDRERLLAVCWRHCALPAVAEPPLFRGRRARRIFAGATALLLAAVVVHGFYDALQSYRLYGDGRPRSTLWGIHDVERFVADGAELPPLLTDETRWRALVVDRETPMEVAGRRWPGTVSVQRMDGSLQRVGVILDEAARTLTFLPPGVTAIEDAPEPLDRLSWERPQPGRLLLRGTWEGREVEIDLVERDLSKLLLLSRGFHWINETPFNR